MSLGPVILCPGQGAQSVGMGRAWLERSPAASDVFAQADRVIAGRFDRPLSQLCFAGPEALLNRTDIAQPAIYTVSVACLRAAFPNLDAASLGAVAGLSLGEYTALHAAGVFTFADGLELVALRGRAMQDAAQAVPSGMVALIGAEPDQALLVCEAAAQGEVLVPANYNAPGQIVISGSAAACDRAVVLASERGLRATRLAVAGAFHSPLMAPAADRLREVLAGVALAPPRCPVVSNVTARPHEGGTGVGFVASLIDRLVEQLTRPVSWSQSCRWLVESGFTEFHELAPGRVLSGLMRRIERSAKVTPHDEPPPTSS